MAHNPVIYPRGFIFSDEKLQSIPKHYKSKVIIDKYYYNFDEDVEEHIREENDNFIIIHGDFVHVGIDGQYNTKGLLRVLLRDYQQNYDDFLETLDFIAGRYVIIIGNNEEVRVFPDAANTRTTYYSTNNNIISSHVHLLNEQINSEKMEYVSLLPDLMNGLIFTPYKEIRSVLPNHYFDMTSKSYTRYFPRENNVYTDVNENEKFELIEHFWNKQIEHYLSKNATLLFSLSGGGDSRFSLALLRKYLSKIKFFTYSRIDGEDNRSYVGQLLTLDYKIVKQMLQDINLDHKFIYFEENKIELTGKEISALNKNTIGRHSSFLIPHIPSNYPEVNLMHIRANLLEIGQARYYRNELKSSDLTEVKYIYDRLYKKTKDENALEYADQLYHEFISVVNYGENTYNYHLLELFQWEVRLARWHSEILNTHDIIFDTISPFNHRAIIDISVSFPYEKKRDEYMYKEIINRNFPILNFYGDNTVLNLYEQERNKKYRK